MKSLSSELRPMLWLLVPLIVYTAMMGILTRLINHGLLIASWSEWRICLLVVIAMLFVTAMCIYVSPEARVISTAISVAPWVIYGLLAALNMFIDWQIYWPPLDWFKNAFAVSLFAPLILCFGYFAHIL